jgi:hypothetical protein
VVDILEKARATLDGEIYTAYHDGEASGWQKGIYEIARNALSKGYSVTVVSEITGLSENVVIDLAERLK